MSIPTIDQWKKETALGIFQPRSSLLVALDKAIEHYNLSRKPDDRWPIKNAFEAWKASKGAGWEKSDRNRTGAITRLSGELDKLDYRIYQITHMPLVELQELEYMKKERAKVISNLFAGKEVKFKMASLPESLKLTAVSVHHKSREALESIGRKAEKFMATGPQLRSPSRITGIGMSPLGGAVGTNPLVAGRSVKEMIQDKMTEMVKKFFQVDNLTLLGPLGSLIMTIVAECSASAAPVIGHIKDGVSALGNWVEAGVDLYKRHEISNRSYSIDIGAPSVAFAALERCLQREADNAAITASIASTSFVVKTGLFFVDGGAVSGPVTGAVAALGEIAHKLYLLGMEYRATRAINTALRANKLDIRLFDTYPLMGCYLLNCATLSDIMPIECFATPGWMEYITQMKRKAVDDIIKASVSLIDKSPWEIRGMPKRPVGPSGGLLSEVSRFGGMASPLAGLTGLKGLGKKN